MLTGHGALRYGTSMWAVMWSCAAMAVDSTLSWLYRSQYVALVAPTSCFGVAVMSESEYMQKVPQDKLLLVIRATFFPKSAKQPNVRIAVGFLRREAEARRGDARRVEAELIRVP